MKKLIPVIIIVSVCIVVAVFFFKGGKTPYQDTDTSFYGTETTLASEIADAFKSKDYTALYELMYGDEGDISPEQFKKEFPVLVKQYAGIDIEDEVQISEKGSDCIITDSKGNSAVISLDDNGKISFEPMEKSFSIYAPKGSAVTFDGKQVQYSETAKSYTVSGVSVGEHTVMIKRENCIPLTKQVQVTADGTNELKTDLQHTEEYLSEYKLKAQEIFTDILQVCADERTDLSEFTFYSEDSKNALQNHIDETVYELSSVDEGGYTAQKIRIGQLKFTDFSGDALCRWNENDGALIANFQYDYTYLWSYTSESYSDSGIDSNVGKGFINMEKQGDRWLIKSVNFTLRKMKH